MTIAKEQLRQIILENDISNVQDVYSFFKESFKDILQELLEVEMDTSIGYVKKIASDFKAFYKAPTEEIALAELERQKKSGAKSTLTLSATGKRTGMW